MFQYGDKRGKDLVDEANEEPTENNRDKGGKTLDIAILSSTAAPVALAAPVASSASAAPATSYASAAPATSYASYASGASAASFSVTRAYVDPRAWNVPGVDVNRLLDTY